MNIDVLSEIDVAYISGLIDGEGSLCICRRKRVDRYGSYQLIPQVLLVNTDKEILEWVQKSLGIGSIRENSNRGRWKRCWVLRIVGMKNLHPILKRLQPHLRIKRRQTEVMLKLIENRNMGAHTGDPYTEADLQLYDEMKKLNARGKA